MLEYGPRAPFRHPNAPDPDSLLYWRRIKEDGFNTDYHVIDDAKAEANHRLIGEIFVTFSKSRRYVQGFYTLDSLYRAVDHIELSESERMQQLQADINAIRHNQQLLRDWRGLTPQQRQFMTERIILQVHRLSRAQTDHRLAAGARLGNYADHKDSLGRDNPLISRRQQAIAEGELTEQQDRDELSLRANQRRQEFVTMLVIVTASTVGTLSSLAAQPLTGPRLERATQLIDSLRIKPFRFARDYLLDLIAGGLEAADLAGAVLAALRAELVLLSVSERLALIARAPKALTQLDILDVEELPQLNLYGELRQVLLDHRAVMQRSYVESDYPAVASAAEKAKKTLRYRPMAVSV